MSTLAPESASTTAGTDRTWTVLAVIATALCAVVTAAVVIGSDWPAFPFDEVTLLQMSRMVAGQPVPEVQGSGYFPLWAVVIAPLWWVVDDPSTVYRASLWIGWAVSMATIVPLALLLRRFGLSVAQGVVVASFVMILPARSIQADYSMSERLVTVLFVLTVLAAFRLVERSSLARHAQLAVLLGLLLLSHLRTTVIVAAAIVWLLMRVRRGRVAVTAAGVAMVAAASLVAHRVGNAMNEALIGARIERGDDLLERFLDSRVDLFARVGIGQSWYQSIASFGVVAFGTVVVVVLTWRELRRWDPGVGTFLLGATAATAAVSLTQWANDFMLFIAPWVRLDVWIYGRYLDPVAAVVVAVGLAALIRGLPRAVGWSAVALTVGVFVSAFGYLTREVPTWGFVTPAHIPGVLPWSWLLPEEPWPRDVGIVPSLTNENRIWLIAPLVVLAVMLLCLLLSRRAPLATATDPSSFASVGAGARRAPQALVVLLLVAATVAAALSVRPSTAFHEVEQRWTVMADRIALAGGDDAAAVGHVRFCERPVAPEGEELQDMAAANYLGYGLLPTVLRTVRTPTDLDGIELVLACEQWPSARELDARRVLGEPVMGLQLWVLPGERQAELERAGGLIGPD